MNVSTVKWAQWDKTQSRELLDLLICVCIALCTIVAHNIAQNRPDNFPSYPPDNHHCSNDVYLREGGSTCVNNFCPRLLGSVTPCRIWTCDLFIASPTQQALPVAPPCHPNWNYRKLFTRRPASTDRTARRQFQANGQPVSRTQASDAMMSRLPRYEAKCVQHRCFQWGSVPLRSDIKGTELPPANILIPLERRLRYNFVAESFYIMKLCSRLFVLYCRDCPKDVKFR